MEPPAVQHAKRIIAATRQSGVVAKLVGGVGYYLHNVEHTDEASAFQREYGDVDMIMSRKAAIQGGQILEELGYEPVTSFNSVQGEIRLMYVSKEPRLRIDIFRGSFEMCHNVPLDKHAFRPEHHPSLNTVELLLTKLQIASCTEKDMLDVASLLAFHEIGEGDDDISASRFTGILGKDWGLWRTVTGNLEKIGAFAQAKAPIHGDRIARQAAELRSLAESSPKSTKWKARAVVGERVRWFEEPEEPEVELDTQVR